MRLATPTTSWVDRVSLARAQRRWFRELDQSIPTAIQEEGLSDLGRRLARLDGDRPIHVVVVPQEGDDHGTFRSGTRNFYWEAYQSLQEQTAGRSVSAFSVPQGADPATWHRGLLAYIADVGATHVITHIESDPSSDGQAWTWSTPARVLSAAWDGVLLGVLFDSSWPWIEAKARYLARQSPRFLAVDICVPLDGRLVRGRPEVGPLNMPMSSESLALIDQRLEGVTPLWDVSFIGAMYPYRMELVERLRASGITVAVNPHRTDAAENFVASRTNQPSWLDYMAGLRSSRMTINFSQASAGPVQQLKTRILEAALAETVLLTDDRDRTRLFFTEGEEFVYFRSVEDLPEIIVALLEQPERLACIAQSAKIRAQLLAPTGFWHGVDAGLRRRGLRAVLPVVQ